VIDLSPRQAKALAQFAYSGDHPVRRIVRSRWRFMNGGAPGDGICKNDIRERAADIDTDQLQSFPWIFLPLRTKIVLTMSGSSMKVVDPRQYYQFWS